MIVIKAKVPHAFFTYASNFTLESMIVTISSFSYDVFTNPDDSMGKLAKKVNYKIIINKQVVKHTADLVQTWLIDMLYDIVTKCDYGKESITQKEALHLVALYNDYVDSYEKNKIKKSDVWLRLYAFFGEQKKFQTSYFFKDDFAREKYILDVVSKRQHPKNIYNVDVMKEFSESLNFSTSEYSLVLFVVFLMFNTSKGIINSKNIPTDFKSSILTYENILKVMNLNCTTIEEFRNSKLKRQLLYSKPIIKINDYYISSNPHLMQSLFVNSNYWIIRNKYQKKNSQQFINAFGVYFEMYVEELLEYCLNPSQFKHIEEDNKRKRADWLINIGDYTFIVEQKSAISLLGIKQNQPDVEAMKKHILKNWGEAVRQLSETQNDLNVPKPIKIILVYEDYYKAECLSELFDLDKSLENDYNYWLVNIREFEMLLMTYKNSPDIFLKIMEEKVKSEQEQSTKGRELDIFIYKNGIRKNDYLKELKIREQYDNIENTLLKQKTLNDNHKKKG